MQRANLATNLRATARIQRAERLVEQQDRRPRRERTGNRHELSLATGKSADGSPGQRVGANARGGLARVIETGRAVRDVLGDAQVRKQVAVLVDEAHPPRFGRKLASVTPIERDSSRAQRKNARDRLEQRCLAGARWPDDDAVPSLRDGERHVTQLERANARVKRANLDHASPIHPVSAADRP